MNPAPVFFPSERSFTVAEVATVGGCVLATPDFADRPLAGVAALSEAGLPDLAFLQKWPTRQPLAEVAAGAVICPEAAATAFPQTVAVLVSRSPQAVFAAVARLMFPSAARPVPVTGETGVSEMAHVDPSAIVEDGAIIEAGAVIGAGAGIGRGTVVSPHAVIGPNCQIGRNGYIGPGASIVAAFIGDNVIIHAGARIGQDGFGYVGGPKGLEKMPQLGRVIIQNDVEIGANTTIDRGALSDTVVGEGTKIDNLVQIAHNVRIGRTCAIAAHSGISGSVTIGDRCMLGGRVGLADHVTLGNDVHLVAASGVMNDIPDGGRWAGTPAKPAREFFREIAALRRLGEGKSKDGNSR